MRELMDIFCKAAEIKVDHALEVMRYLHDHTPLLKVRYTITVPVSAPITTLTTFTNCAQNCAVVYANTSGGYGSKLQS